MPPAIRARRWRPLVVALAVAAAIAGALVGGFAWVASGRLIALGSLTLLTIHAWFGLVLVPLVVVHVLPRRWRVLRPPANGGVSRRALLTAAGLAVAGIGTFVATASLDRLVGGVRRFTGSRWLEPGGVPPATTFYGEPPPTIDIGAWRLTADGRAMALDDLRALGEVDLTAVLDCTSGWVVETTWRGVPLSSVTTSLPVAASASGR